jgi:MFS transporter, MHS family, proline/betaine transporter
MQALRSRRGHVLRSYGDLGVALLLGALVSAAVMRGLSPEALDGWGWRIPFLLGLAIGPVGLYIRRHLDETAASRSIRGAEAGAKSRESFLLGISAKP